MTLRDVAEMIRDLDTGDGVTAAQLADHLVPGRQGPSGSSVNGATRTVLGLLGRLRNRGYVGQDKLRWQQTRRGGPGWWYLMEAGHRWLREVTVTEAVAVLVDQPGLLRELQWTFPADDTRTSFPADRDAASRLLALGLIVPYLESESRRTALAESCLQVFDRRFDAVLRALHTYAGQSSSYIIGRSCNCYLYVAAKDALVAALAQPGIKHRTVTHPDFTCTTTVTMGSCRSEKRHVGVLPGAVRETTDSGRRWLREAVPTAEEVELLRNLLSTIDERAAYRGFIGPLAALLARQPGAAGETVDTYKGSPGAADEQ